MLGTARGLGVATLVAALTVGAAAVGPAGPAAAAPAPPPGPVRWSDPLAAGEAVGVLVVGGTVRLTGDRAGAADAALSPDGHGDTRSPGLLTLPARPLAVPVDRVDAVVDVAAGTAAVDVRGRRADGGWSEWLPAEPVPGAPGTSGQAAGATLRAVLPAPATQVQARLVLDPPGPGAPAVAVRGLALAAYPAGPGVRALALGEAERYRVFATREGLVGGTTANGHRVKPRDLFVALPSRRALSPRDTSDYSVRVCAANGRCAYAPVWDVGPWNTRDDYWNGPDRRQDWRDLPRGVPQAQAAKAANHNRGKDQFGRPVRNPAGIDLADGLFWDALGLRDNAWVTVDYLWTGAGPLATVRVDRRVDLREAPNPGARVVGLVADRAAVPLQCATGDWLQVGAGEFLPRAAVPRSALPPAVPACRG